MGQVEPCSGCRERERDCHYTCDRYAEYLEGQVTPKPGRRVVNPIWWVPESQEAGDEPVV